MKQDIKTRLKGNYTGKQGVKELLRGQMYTTREESQEAKAISKQIANTILNQMKAMDFNLLICMGARDYLIIPNGLQFKVSGLGFKGNVKITLNGKDLYDVELVKRTRTLDKELSELAGEKFWNYKFETKKKINDLYNDQLMEILESEVENRG